MNPDVKAKWLQKLRSGEYDQGRFFLRRKGRSEAEADRYCCLGVLCEVAVEEGVIPPAVSGHSWGDYRYMYDDGSEQALPDAVADWAGLDDGLGTLVPGVARLESACPCASCRIGGIPEAHTLAELNDDLGYTFDQIADVIEERL